MPRAFGLSKAHATPVTAEVFSDRERQKPVSHRTLPLKSKKIWKEKDRKLATPGQDERFSCR
jgi:hypothetical protein